MKKIEGDNMNITVMRTTSVIIVSLLITSGFLIVVPISSPTVKALLVHDTNTASWEDDDASDGDPFNGLDFNGDPARDGKVTWHAVNNTHIVNQNFIVEDGYIFEIEAGCVIQVDPGIVIQIGDASTDGALFFSNGTSGSEITITQNVPGSAWNGLTIITRSYGYINSTVVDGGAWIAVEEASLDMDYGTVTNMNQLGIYALFSTINITNTYIANSSIASIYCEDSDAFIDNNEIYSYNGFDGSPSGIDGGHGIYLTGASSYITISNNTIYGGNGGDDISGGGGGAGGSGIFDFNYYGQLSIIDNDIIQGGNGGNNTSPDNFAGNGGLGVHVIPVPDSALLDISSNTVIRGGRGGNNDAPIDGKAGNGGAALRITDNPETFGNVSISGNQNIIGGEGGHNHADWDGTFGGWTAGEGGDGIFLMNCKDPCTVTIEGNPIIVGGKGGNNTGVGDFVFPTPTAGDGRNGILVMNSTNVYISSSIVTGGHGGNNTPDGVMAFAGDGGSGIILYNPSFKDFSSTSISASTLIGGEGGDDWVGGSGMQGGPGRGGSGLYSSQGFGICSSSDLLGGKGGDNYGPFGGGGAGGMGAGITSSFDWMISGGNVTGGKGGANFEASGGGGSGGSAVSVSNNCDNITLYGILSIVGGDGGDAETGGLGQGAYQTIQANTCTDINIDTNVITTGRGGYNASSGAYGPNGLYCIFGTNLGGSNLINGNDITANDTASGTIGIYLDPSTATISDNDIYENEFGINIQDSKFITIGDNNRIFNNSVGIYLTGSDVTIGTGNTISDNDYGIVAGNSDPVITGDQVLNSSEIGLFLDSGSDATVEGVSVIDSGTWSVYCDGGSNPQFYNSTIATTLGSGDFIIGGDSHPWTLNTTFDNSTANYLDSLSNLTVNWYLHVKVVDSSYFPVGSANVKVNDTYDNNVFNGTTPGDGWIRWIIVTEYVENQTGGKYYYTPHNISAREGIRFAFDITTMNMSKEVIISLGGIQVSIPLYAGWNMISIPVNMSDTTITNVLSDIDGNYVSIWWYNLSDNADPWKLYNVDKPDVDLFNIERKMGIWILVRFDDTLTVGGTEPDPTLTDIDLKAGWNFVGYPSIATRIAGVNPGDAFNSISAFVDTVQYYNASDIVDPWKEWDIGSYTSDDLTEIKFGYGLWIYVTGACTWSVDW